MNKQAKYDKENTVMLSIKLNKKTDRDILEYLDTVENRSGTFKAAIREFMKK